MKSEINFKNICLQIVEFLLNNKLATEIKGNLLISHPDSISKLTPAEAPKPTIKPEVKASLLELPKPPESASKTVFFEQFIRYLCKLYKVPMQSRLSFNASTVANDYKIYSKGSKYSEIKVSILKTSRN